MVERPGLGAAIESVAMTSRVVVESAMNVLMGFAFDLYQSQPMCHNFLVFKILLFRIQNLPIQSAIEVF